MSTENVREALAAYAHEAWSGWMRYMWGKATPNEDGTLTLSAWAVERWRRQMSTAYDELPEEEKASDRKEADQMLAIVDMASEIKALRAVLSAARSSYDVNYHPAEDGDLYQAIAAYDRLVGGA